MNIGSVFAMLMQMGVCGTVNFNAADGTTLRVLVCPATVPARPAEPAPDPGATEPKQTPLLPGQKRV